MTRYRVDFDRRWIMGRWGFTDRVFYTLGGVEAPPKGLSNAWEVSFRGKPRDLGLLLQQRLHIDSTDQSQFGTIFEITELDRRAGP
ncbi:MAG: hypothetical protein HY342_11665 [Candidatus Lambdaproteobacteria bacterium]|nr:hypothetical protein [Candidatus Lambdaproteobacteria bacterium]